MCSYRKYRNIKTNQEQLHITYTEAQRDGKLFEVFVKSIVPVISHFYNKAKAHFTDDEFDDICSEVLEICLKTMRNNVCFENKSQTSSYITHIIKTVFRDKLKYYNSNHNVDISGMEEQFITNTFSHTQTYLKIHFKQLLSILVDTFNDTIRFVGKEKKLCQFIFDKILKDEEIDSDYLSKKFRLDADFYVNYVRLLVRSLLYRMKIARHHEFQYLINE